MLIYSTLLCMRRADKSLFYRLSLPARSAVFAISQRHKECGHRPSFLLLFFYAYKTMTICLHDFIYRPWVIVSNKLGSNVLNLVTLKGAARDAQHRVTIQKRYGSKNIDFQGPLVAVAE
jgi:hypothetical protein